MGQIIFFPLFFDRLDQSKERTKMAEEIGSNKSEVGVALCYLLGIITSGILIAIWTAMTSHWTIALFLLAGWYFAFLIAPFYIEVKETKLVNKHSPGRNYKQRG